MNHKSINDQRLELSVQSKNGTDFTFAATIMWLIISFIWSLDYQAYSKSVLVFYSSGVMFPLALLFSKLLKTNWKVKDNQLQSLGIWLNITQLLYFPFLVFVLIKMPEYFVMTYAIITGAHLFPYSWLYKTKWYAFFSVIIVAISLTFGLSFQVEKFYYIALTTSVLLCSLSVLLLFDYKKKV